MNDDESDHEYYPIILSFPGSHFPYIRGANNASVVFDFSYSFQDLSDFLFQSGNRYDFQGGQLMHRLSDLVLSLSSPSSLDLIHIVDVSDTTDDPEGTSKKMAFGAIYSSIPNFDIGVGTGVLRAASGFVSSDSTTSDLPEGTNLYYSDARVESYITAGEGIDFSSGVISGEDATTSNKGISSFNSANFSVSSGAVNTIQNINTTSNFQVSSLLAGVGSPSSSVVVRGYSNNPSSWKGGAAFGYTSASIIMGELSGVATIGGHNAGLSAWADLAINTGAGNVSIGTNTFNNKLTVNGSASIGTTSAAGTNGLRVGGETQLDSGATVGGDAIISGSLGVTGATTLSSDLGVEGVSIFSNHVVVEGASLSVFRNSGQALGVGGDVVYYSNSTVAAVEYTPSSSGSSSSSRVVGYQFTVDSVDPLEVSHLGYNSTFITGNREVGIYDMDENLLASVTVTTSSTLEGNFRYEEVVGDTSLLPGESYVIAAVTPAFENIHQPSFSSLSINSSISIVVGRISVSASLIFPTSAFTVGPLCGPGLKIRDANYRYDFATGDITHPVGNLTMTSGLVRIISETASRLAQFDENKDLVSSDLSSWLSGGTGITVTDDMDGTVTLSSNDGEIDHGSLSGLSDDDHAQYHTDARALTWLGTASTTNLPEGTNLYYTDARVESYITAGEGIDFSSGVISGEDATTANKGIASFNGTNFSVSSGAVNTIQSIDTSADFQASSLLAGIGTPSSVNVVVRGYSNNPSYWKGGAAFGYTSASVIMGELAGVATIGGHNAGLSAWVNLSISSGGGNVSVGGVAPASKLSVTGGLTVGGTIADTTASPSNGILVEGNIRNQALSASRIVSSGAGKDLESTDLASWVAGTSDQITVTDDTDGTITLSLPQSIASSSSPSFAGLTLTGAATFASVVTISAFDGTNEGAELVWKGAGSFSDWTQDVYQSGMRIFANSSVTQTLSLTNAGSGRAELSLEGSIKFDNTAIGSSDTVGLVMNAAYVDYRIGFDNAGGTGLIRFNVDTPASTIHGFRFSAGDISSGAIVNYVSFRTNGTNGFGTIAPNTTMHLYSDETITGDVTDDYSSSLTIQPIYSANSASNFTITRHNYFDINDVVASNSGAGSLTVTDGCIFRFDSSAGTHCAVDSGTTKATPSNVDGWIKYNINGTVYYSPVYTSKTA